MNITIINLNLGNIGSIYNMLKKIGITPKISSHSRDIEAADKLIIPGVGSFDSGVESLETTGLSAILHEKVITQKTPLLGICLGMQLLTKSSEEGRLPGLGWIDGTTVRFNFNSPQKTLKIPHMGWNTINVTRKNPLFEGLEDNSRFYFVHSYHVQSPEEYSLTKTHHGYDFLSAINKNNIWGVQFHPEKSHKFGMTLLKNFVEKC